jgi:membrane protein
LSVLKIQSRQAAEWKRESNAVARMDAPDQIHSSSGTSDAEQLGIASLFGGATLLLGVNRGTTALFHGLNAVYGRKEERGLLAFAATSLVFAVGAIVFLYFAIAAVVLFPGLLNGIGLEAATAYIVDLLWWLVILLVVGLVLAVVYRFGPSRDGAESRCIALGSGAASLLWVCTSLLFSWVVSWLGALVELYGSVGVMMGFMTWIWLSVTVVLIGAELDASASEENDQICPEVGPHRVGLFGG